MRRSQELEDKYRRELKKGNVPFAKRKVIFDFDDWLVIRNDFPYDLLYRKHHLLIPKVAFSKFTDISRVSQVRYHVILSKLEEHYDLYFVNMAKNRSVRSHWHCHLARYR